MLTWGKRTYIMGIINVTPDSFSGDSILQKDDPIQYAVEKARQFIADGADILDIGAESSRPGSHPISAEEELERLMPVIRAIKQEDIDAILSVDTYKSEVAESCLEIGADWINDIWGLQMDALMAKVVARTKAPVILMHNRSRSSAIQQSAGLGASYQADEYDDFFRELLIDLEALAQNAINAGINSEDIILDPGIGFGKTISQNLQIIKHLNQIKALGYPVLIGPSRKSFIGKVLDLPVEERMEGTAASVAVGIIHGADIIRVHDVKQMVRIARMTDALIGRTL